MGNTQKKTEAEKTKWQNILRIYKRDFKNILHNPVALLITVGSVSYTHLDVYKRQMQRCWKFCSKFAVNRLPVCQSQPTARAKCKNNGYKCCIMIDGIENWGCSFLSDMVQ